MALPFAARQQFLERGYAILPNVLSPSVVARVREGAISSTTARARYFSDLPSMDSLLKNSPKLTDPFFNQVVSHAEKRRHILDYYRAVKQRKRRLRKVVREFLNGRTREELTGEELWKLSELVAGLSAVSSGRNCTSTVYDDGQMLRAINHYRANAWMTNKQLAAVLKEADFTAPLSQLAEIVGGVEKPVIFSDAPLLRGAYGGPAGYHCTAPQFGTRTNVDCATGTPAVTLLLFTYTPSRLCLQPHIMEHSHRFVREQYIRRVHPNRLFSTFLPLEGHIPFQLKQFTFDSSVVAHSLLPEDVTEAAAAASHALGEAGFSPSASESPVLAPGTVMVVDPHLMMAFGPNLTAQSEVVYRLNVVSEDAKPYLHGPSWVRGWRSVPREVSFAAPIVFPPLYRHEPKQA